MDREVERPKTSIVSDLMQGIEKTVDWYLANEQWLNNVTSGDYKKYYETQYSKR